MNATQEAPVSVALLLMCTLSSLFLVAYSVPSPKLTIPQVLACEDGIEVSVSGILVDQWRYDGGSEALILADIASRTQLKVVVVPGIAPAPGNYVSIGDEIEVTGEITSSRGARYLLAPSDQVDILRESQDAISVRIAAEHWALFEGDSIELRGLLVYDETLRAARIQDLDGSCSISLEADQVIHESFVGQEALLVGVVRFDIATASVVISVQDLTVAGGTASLFSNPSY